MQVSSFLAKLRCLVLAVFSISLLGMAVAADFIFRHEVTRQARRELEEAGLQVNVGGIIKAIREEKIALFANYDTAGIDFGGVDKMGMTPLHFAIIEKNSAAIEQLFLRKTQLTPSVDTPASDGFTPFKRALEQRDFDLADRLVNDLGAELEFEKTSGLPWLIEAMNTGDLELRDYFLRKGANVNQKGSQPYFPLAIAADADDLPVMQLLVDHGAKVRVAGVSGKPLLLESALENEYEEMEFLLENGSNPDVSVDKQDPLTVAMSRQDGYMKDLMLRHGATVDRAGPSGRHFLFEAYDTGDHDWLMYLLESGISVNLKSTQGETLLMNSARNGDYQMMDFLLSKEADINLPDKEGLTPLQYAVGSGDTAMIRTLIEKGAQIHPEAMMKTAYQRRDNPTMNLLLNAGVDPDVEMEGTDNRVFDVAVAEGSVETVRTLLAADAKLGNNLWTALISRQDDLITTFLQHGADFGQVGPDGKTPLEYVLQEKQFHLVRPILESGVHTTPMFNPKETWLSRTIRNGDSEIALALLKADISLGDEKAGDGHSLLGWSIANEMDEVSIELIERGVDVNVMEPSPATDSFVEKFDESTLFRKNLKVDRKIRPLMMTSVKRNHEVAQALVNAGAKNHASAKYYYPISIASWYSDVRMMQIVFGLNPDVQKRKLVVDLSRQRVQLYQNGKVTYSSACSTGKPGYRTKSGTYVITQKNRHHVSSLYDAAMPYFMRLSCSDFGFHIGNCPGHAASHGCIRLPSAAAAHYYATCSLGDMVVIKP